MEDQTVSPDIIRGHIDTIILRMLLGGDRYGYQIGKEIQTATEGRYELKEATMYSSLKRLEKGGFISSYWGDETSGGRRRYYRITDNGRKLYAENKTNWEYAKKLLEILL